MDWNREVLNTRIMGVMALLCGAGMVGMLLAGPAQAADEETNKKILKDAIVGAITGVAAVEATKDDAAVSSAAGKAEKTEKDGKGPKKNFGKKKKDKKRPYGWDQGKKTGWGDSDVPPGLAKKKD